MERRSFLSKLGIALGITAVPVLALPERVKLFPDKQRTPDSDGIVFNGIDSYIDTYFMPTNNGGLFFNDEGSKMRVINPDGDDFIYDLTKPWDLTTTTFDATLLS